VCFLQQPIRVIFVQNVRLKRWMQTPLKQPSPGFSSGHNSVLANCYGHSSKSLAGIFFKTVVCLFDARRKSCVDALPWFADDWQTCNPWFPPVAESTYISRWGGGTFDNTTRSDSRHSGVEKIRYTPCGMPAIFCLALKQFFAQPAGSGNLLSKRYPCGLIRTVGLATVDRCLRKLHFSEVIDFIYIILCSDQ
ncbi:MAG: hypothetical protein AAF404_08355, partial [Pseudomonadota bacterium]